MAVFVAGSVLAGLSMGLTPVAHRNRIGNRALVGAA
jgi:hypothetical protein